jgi:hypothetical protein
MARKLAIADKVLVPVTVVIPNLQGRKDTFKFNLVCTRLPTEALQKSISDGQLSNNDFLKGIVVGWDGQKLVLEDDGTPSAFSPEALDDLLSIAGVPALCTRAYMAEVMAKEKN